MASTGRHSISLALAALRVGVGSPKARSSDYGVGATHRQAPSYSELLAGPCNFLSISRRRPPVPLDHADGNEVYWTEACAPSFHNP